MKKTIIGVLMFAIAGVSQVLAHCEIPCGIYDDAMRIKMLAEHITTMEKCLSEIKVLQSADKPDANQLVRWITNKDAHAVQFQEIVWQYFMTQRIKPVKPGSDGYDKYIRELTLLHQMCVYAMKVKQSSDPENIKKLRELLKDFQDSYLGVHQHH